MPSRPAVFLDRDDTLILCREVSPDGDLGDPRLVRLAPGAVEACERLRAAGFVLVVVSNQGGVARGRYSPADVDAVNRRINELLGGAISAFRFCPYHPGGTVARFAREHSWRKPSPGMVLDAAEVLGLDLSRSWLAGDSERDIAAGKAAGCRTVLLRNDSTGTGRTTGLSAPDAVASDLAQAAAIMLGDPATFPQAVHRS